MNWDEYEVYQPGVAGPLGRLPRADARRAFDRLMTAKPRRIEILGRLMRANDIVLSSTDDGIQDLNDWFLANVQPDPSNPGRLLPEWYSVVNDIALFLGDVMIERCPNLRWEFFTGGKTDVSHQRHVIVGFTKVAVAKYNMDVDRLVSTYAHRIVASRGSIPHYGSHTVRGVEVDVDAAAARQRSREVDDDAFWRWVKTAESQA